MSLQSVFDIVRVRRTELTGAAKSVISAFAKVDTDGDTDAPEGVDESAPFDWWQQYGFISRPPEDSESLIVRVGANVFGLASRALASAKAFGQLSAGDVALYSLGGALLKLAVTGAVTLLVPAGNKQTVVHISNKDGSIKGVVPPGLAFEISPKNGIMFNAGNADVTIAGANIQLVGQQLNINCGVVKTHMAATVPLASAFVASATPCTAANVFV